MDVKHPEGGDILTFFNTRKVLCGVDRLLYVTLCTFKIAKKVKCLEYVPFTLSLYITISTKAIHHV